MKLKIVIFIYLSLCYVINAHANQTLVFTGIQGSVNSEISFSVLQEAYRQISIEIEYLPLPGERALQTANAGRVDGEVFRIANVDKTYTNLVPVPTPINVLEGVVFSNEPNLQINGWESLREHRIGIQVGIKFAERGTQGMQRTVVDTNEQLFRMLAAKRVDVAVVALTNGLQTINSLKLTDIYAISPSIQQFPLYHYLHKKNHTLVEKLDAVLKKMHTSGRITQLRNTALQRLAPETFAQSQSNLEQ